MKKLTDVYIKVTKANVEELQKLLQYPFAIDVVIVFEFDNKDSWYITEDTYCKKVSLTELKRLIDTIPTREEIKRLKQQVSGYKTNLSLTNERCKELQSDNERLVHNLKTTEERYLRLSVNFDVLQKNYKVLLGNFNSLKEENKQLKQRKWWQIWK